MTKRKPWAQSTLLLRVMAELGSGRIYQGRIRDASGAIVDGCCEHGRGRPITLDASWALVEVLIHELLHRMHPHWGERYTHQRTKNLMQQLTDDQVHVIRDEYERRKSIRRTENYIDGDDD